MTWLNKTCLYSSLAQRHATYARQDSFNPRLTFKRYKVVVAGKLDQGGGVQFAKLKASAHATPVSLRSFRILHPRIPIAALPFIGVGMLLLQN